MYRSFSWVYLWVIILASNILSYMTRWYKLFFKSILGKIKLFLFIIIFLQLLNYKIWVIVYINNNNINIKDFNQLAKFSDKSSLNFQVFMIYLPLFVIFCLIKKVYVIIKKIQFRFIKVSYEINLKLLIFENFVRLNKNF